MAESTLFLRTVVAEDVLSVTRRPNNRSYNGAKTSAGRSQRPDVIGPLLHARLKASVIRVQSESPNTPNTWKFLRTSGHNNTGRFDHRSFCKEDASVQQRSPHLVFGGESRSTKAVTSATTPDSTSTGSIYLYTYIYIYCFLPAMTHMYACGMRLNPDQEDLRHAMPASMSIADPAGASIGARSRSSRDKHFRSNIRPVALNCDQGVAARKREPKRHPQMRSRNNKKKVEALQNSG